MMTEGRDQIKKKPTEFRHVLDRHHLRIIGSDLTQEQIDEMSKFEDIEALKITCGWSFGSAIVSGERLGTLNGIDFSKFSNFESLEELFIQGLDGTIDLSPFTQPSSIIIDVGTDPHLCDSYNPYVTFPESSRLESLLIHGNIEHDRKTLPLLPNLKSITYHSLRETDLSWLNSSKSITHIRIVRWVPENVILPSISSLESISFVGWRKRDPTTLKMVDLSPLRVSKGLREVAFLRQNISEIDFSPLSAFSELDRIRISQCNLGEVDLTPLEQMNLKDINLAGNRIHKIVFPRELNCECFDVSRNELQRINLSRFSSSVLRELNLGANPLVDIDLTPLSACVNLEKLEMEHTQLDSIDLTPLAGLEHLSVFRIKSRFMFEIDVTPLLSCPTLDEVKLGKIKPIADSRKSDEIASPRLKKMKKKITWY
ncbi:MAG: hypothetical protein ACXAAO_08405 [Candidatus Thorarchaeota archaeon]|jgi:hypothetical protein